MANFKRKIGTLNFVKNIYNLSIPHFALTVAVRGLD